MSEEEHGGRHSDVGDASASIGCVPDDVLRVLFKFLGPVQRARCGAVCKAWRDIATSPDAGWSHLTLRIIAFAPSIEEFQRVISTYEPWRGSRASKLAAELAGIRPVEALAAARILAQPRFAQLQHVSLEIGAFWGGYVGVGSPWGKEYAALAASIPPSVRRLDLRFWEAGKPANLGDASHWKLALPSLRLAAGAPGLTEVHVLHDPMDQSTPEGLATLGGPGSSVTHLGAFLDMWNGAASLQALRAAFPKLESVGAVWASGAEALRALAASGITPRSLELSSVRFDAEGEGRAAARCLEAVVRGGRCEAVSLRFCEGVPEVGGALAGARSLAVAGHEPFGLPFLRWLAEAARADALERLELTTAGEAAAEPPLLLVPAGDALAALSALPRLRQLRLGPWGVAAWPDAAELADGLPRACPALREAAVLPSPSDEAVLRRVRGGARPATVPAALFKANARLQAELRRRREPSL